MIFLFSLGKRIGLSENEIKQDLNLFRELSKTTFETEERSLDEEDYGDNADGTDSKSNSSE